MKRFTDGLVTFLRFFLLALMCVAWFTGLLVLMALVFVGWGKTKAKVLWQKSSFTTLRHELR